MGGWCFFKLVSFIQGFLPHPTTTHSPLSLAPSRRHDSVGRLERSLEEGHQSFVDTRSQLEEVEKKVSTRQEGEYLGVGVLGKKGGVVAVSYTHLTLPTRSTV